MVESSKGSLGSFSKHGGGRSWSFCLKAAPVFASIILVFWSMLAFHKSHYHRNNLSELHDSTSFRQVLPFTSQRRSRRVSDKHDSSLLPLLFSSNEDGVRLRIRPKDYVPPSLTIISAPLPFTESENDPQRLALLSWLRLSPPPTIILLSADPAMKRVAKEFKKRVYVERTFDTTFHGVPQFHSIIARAQAATTDLVMVISSDIVLLSDTMTAIQKVHSLFSSWMLIARRWDMSAEKREFPVSLEASALVQRGEGEGGEGGGEEDVDSGSVIRLKDEEMDEIIKKWVRRSQSRVRGKDDADVWIWNDPSAMLFNGTVPPFTLGASHYQEWLTNEVVTSEMRVVVEASEALTAIRVAAPLSSAGGKVQTRFLDGLKAGGWEYHHNGHMASFQGLKMCTVGPIWSARPRKCACTCPPAYARVEGGDENSISIPRLSFVPEVPTSWVWGCAVEKPTKSPLSRPIATVPTLMSSVPGLPHRMEDVLSVSARHIDNMKIVTLVAVTFGYAEMLMNFVCRLRLINASDNLVVAALDEDLYRYAALQGLAVYYERASDSLKSKVKKGSDCAFGTQCFRQFTKLKSRAVLKLLQAGYSVLWTDVDIVWFKDPLKELMSFGPGTLPIQSNEPNVTLPGTGIRRINSGFYFARSDKMTIDAFVAITDHASKTKLSEQPSFYDILCGVKGELRVPNKPECKWSNGLRTVFLSRAFYPNGAVHGFWAEKNTTDACVMMGCVILHNNWISGKDAKRDRLVDNDFWHYDVERRMCMYPWHSRLPLLPEYIAKQEEIAAAREEEKAKAAAKDSSDKD
eukprot:TRINITY_DN692_c0_g1_i1.p1 TRINITY_DN692_c0_g1~~TRINITY_DN692_c0_g1_i1.p1  ORF type:complete len:802 (+),score=72.91 TRINITY_DN692_c0_g1_i1:430-2835(+)